MPTPPARPLPPDAPPHPLANPRGGWLRPVLAVVLAAAGSVTGVGAQVVAPPPPLGASATAPAEPEAAGAARKYERIVVEDAGSRVEESRLGGVTQHIAVQPKNGAPAYQVEPLQIRGPAAPASERSGHSGSTGRASWRVWSF